MYLCGENEMMKIISKKEMTRLGASVAEYYGKRTDVDYPVIEPLKIIKGTVPCPFTDGGICKKVKSGKNPVCSVRDSNGILWINCSERLCSSKKDIPLSEYQSSILLDVGKHVYGDSVSKDDVCIKREERLNVVDGTKYNADFILSTKSGISEHAGPDKLVLEMQGGGETTNTGELTRHVDSWRQLPPHQRTNAFLREPTQASPLVTNAWRRQQEQFIVKGNIALETWKGQGMAFCVGSLLYDYLMDKLKNYALQDLEEYNWTLGIFTFVEDTLKPVLPGPIPLKIDESRCKYTNYQSFVHALINQGTPSRQAFIGKFINLNNEEVIIG